MFENFRLNVNLLLPEGQTRSIVIMLHGIGEHGGCYTELAKECVAQSIGFLTFDMRGHGQSPGIRGHSSIRTIKNDVRFIVGEIKKQYPEISIVLFGHSMGGQIAMSLALDETINVCGVIASSPFLKLAHPPAMALVKLAKWASYIVPCLTIKTGIKAGQLSQNSVNTKSRKTDPLLHNKISIKLFSDLYFNGRRIVENKYHCETPFLLMHGTDDTIISFEVCKLFANNNKQFIEFKEWRDMRHDLLNDAGKENVFNYVLQAIQAFSAN